MMKSRKTEHPVLCYCSDIVHCSNETCIASNGASCFHYAEIRPTGRVVNQEHVFGCLQDEDHGGGIWQCRAGLLPHAVPKNIRCCNDEDFCNLKLNTTVTGSPVETDLSAPANYFWSHDVSATTVRLVSIIICCFLSAVLICCVLYAIDKKRRKRSPQLQRPGSLSIYTHDPGKSSHQLRLLQCFRRAQKARIRHTTHCSGSSSNIPCLGSTDPSNKSSLTPTATAGNFARDSETTDGFSQSDLVERTLAHELKEVKKIGEGSYGHVYLALFRGDKVAMKVFPPSREREFERECSVYETHLLRNENILSYIGSDLQSKGDCTRRILVTDYCEYGSLYDFLRSSPVQFENALTLIRTAASGLDYLHNSVIGTQNSSKPAIAHRDIKSRNILVKKNFSCVIADLGLAVRLLNGKLDECASVSQGTVRYMPPEILVYHPHFVHNRMSFESYKQADMYSFSLVMWEVLNRCIINEKCNAYKVPYEDLVGGNAGEAKLREVVCVKKERPALSPEWDSSDNSLVEVASIMRQCWSENPEARLTSRYVKIKLNRLCAELQMAGDR